MKKTGENEALFIDFNGIMLTNMQGHLSRKVAAEAYIMDLKVCKDTDQGIEGVCVSRKLTIEDYLWLVAFHEQRPFTLNEFKTFIISQSDQYPEMIELVQWLKTKYGLQIDSVYNRGSGLNEYRIRKFILKKFTDTLISSCFIHIRKTDVDIFRNALETADVPIDQIFFIENTPMLVEAAESLGIKSMFCKNHSVIRRELIEYGLQVAQ